MENASAIMYYVVNIAVLQNSLSGTHTRQTHRTRICNFVVAIHIIDATIDII